MIIQREKELEVLKQAYRNMQQSGQLQIRFISGEAGTGKTVLADAFIEEAKQEAEKTMFVSTYCCIRSEYTISYQPFKELLKNLLHDVKEEEGMSVDENKPRIKDSLKFCAKMLVEHAPDLVGNFVPGVSLISALGQTFFKEDEEKNKAVTVEESKIMEQYTDAIRAIASNYKLVLFLDDLQWIDKSSVNLLYQLLMGLQNSPVMIIGCYRSTDIDIHVNGEKHPISKLITEVKISHGNVFLNLDVLSNAERKELMNRMLDIDTNIYDYQFREKLFERTNGNPLFVRELVNLLKEQYMLVCNNDGVWMNNSNLRWNSYPVRIEGIIQERIGRLEDSLVEILSHASVQGYNFIAQVLSKTMGEPERDLLMTLSRTLQKQHHLVYEGDCIRSNKGVVSSFNFSNYIFQQYLYHSLSMTQRMMLHSDIAGILEELFKDDVDIVANDIARHYEMSGEYEKAIRYIKLTVDSMMRVSGYQEASVLCRKALSFLDEMQKADEVLKEKLHFQVQLCICYQYIKGWGDPEVKDIYEQAKLLSKELQNYEYIGLIRFGLWSIHLAKLELDECLQLTIKNLETSKSLNNRSMTLMAMVSKGNTLFWMGDNLQAGKILEEYLKETEEDEWPDDNAKLNQLFAYMFLLLISCRKKDNSVASTYKSKILKQIEVNHNHFYRVVAYHVLGWYSWLIDDAESMRLYSQQLLELCRKYNFQFYHGIGEIFYGAGMLAGNDSNGEQMVQKGYQALIDLCKCEPTIMHSVYGLILGRYFLKAKQYDKTGSFLKEIIENAEQKNERAYLDELYLLQGEYLLAVNQKEKATEAFRKALEQARKNGSVDTELKIKSISKP